VGPRVVGQYRRVVVATSSGHPALYDTLVALHVVCAIIGFGSVALSGWYGATASHPDRPGSAEEAGRYFRSPGRAEWLVLAVPFLGAGALGLRPSGADFGATWVIAASVIWLAAAGVLLGVVRPAERRLRSASRAGSADPVAAGTDRVRRAGPGAGRPLMWGAAACDVLFVVALVFMVGQPA
jgi:hypothetical protein